MNDVILFRAVMEGEHAQIHDTNTLQNPGGIESKYFATSERGANSYAKLAFGRFGDESPYYIIRVAVPSALIQDILSVDGGIGTVVLQTEQLIGLVPEMLNVCMRIE